MTLWMDEWQRTRVPTRQRWAMCGAHTHPFIHTKSTSPPTTHKNTFFVNFSNKKKTFIIHRTHIAHSRRTKENNITFQSSIRFSNLSAIKLTTSRHQQRLSFALRALNRTQEVRICIRVSGESIHATAALMSFWWYFGNTFRELNGTWPRRGMKCYSLVNPKSNSPKKKKRNRRVGTPQHNGQT